MDFDYLVGYLKQHKITRQQFADEIGVPIGTVNTWFFRKPKKIPAEIAVKIAFLYHVPIEKLIGKFADEETIAEINKGIDEIWESAEKEAIRKEKLISCFEKLNDDGQEKVIDYADTLTKVPEYQAKQEENDTESNH